MARIAIVLNTSWNIYNFRLPLLKRLSECGHEIVAIAPEDEYTGKIPYPFQRIAIKSRSVNPLRDMIVFINFLRIFRRVKPDIVLLYTIKPNVYGNFAAGLLGIPAISNIAGLGALFIKQNLFTRLARSLYRIALTVPGKVFFQNRDDLELFVRDRLVAEHKAERIPGSGVDLARFRPGQDHERKTNGKLVFLLFSRMLWDKGVGEFAEAAGLLLGERKDVEFLLLGFLDVDNPQAITRADMDRLTAAGTIRFLGATDEVEKIIRQADCVVLPSYREGMPRTLLEAAAMGRPIITTDAPGCRDVVDDGQNGLLCRVGDARDLYEKMKIMAGLSAEEREAMGTKGRRKMEREFDQEIVLAKYSQAVDELLAR